MRALFALLLCVLFAGCSVRLYGHQSTSGGTTTTTTSSQVSGSAKFAGGKVAFSSGQVPPANAPGGHLKLSGGAAAVLLVGVAIADAVNYLGAKLAAKSSQPPAPGTGIADTCSCYQKPVTSDQ